MEEFAALTGDLIESRNIPNRSAVQEKLLSVLAHLNETYADAIVVPFSITLGDEFQGLLSEAPAALTMIAQIERHLRPVHISFGLGIGTIATPLASSTTQMDGECFHRSRQAVEAAKSAGRRLVFVTGRATFDASLNTIEMLLDVIRSRWNETHIRRAWEYDRLGTLEKVAQEEGVTAQAVFKAFKHMRLDEVRAAEKTVRQLLAEILPPSDDRGSGQDDRGSG